jgi:hypothetical protein
MAHCIEVVVYKVKHAQTAEAARRAARPHIEALPGFLGWQAVTSTEDPLSFTDILTWKSLGDAKAAGKKMMADPACAPFMAEIAEVVSMGHYV